MAMYCRPTLLCRSGCHDTIDPECFCGRTTAARTARSTPTGRWWSRCAHRMGPVKLNGADHARRLRTVEVFNEQGEAQQLKLFPAHVEAPADDPQVARVLIGRVRLERRSEEHTSELQSP